MSSPGHPRGYGIAESVVKIVKNMMRKIYEDGRDHYLAFLELRNTPRQYFDLNPAEMMFKWKTHSLLPIATEC